MQLQGKYPRIVPKTASFTLDPTTTRCGTIFSNRGAGGAVTMTLPQLTNSQAGSTWDGYWVELQAEVDQNVAVACTAGKAVVDGNAAATSLTASTANHKIGACIRAVWSAALQKWFVRGTNVGVTYTVA
jgi:hypothetical protein